MVSTAAPGIVDERLQRLLDAVVAEYAPLEVWLFGSRAEGRARPDSDYDLLVVLPDDVEERAFDIHRAGDVWRRLLIPADIIPCTKSDFIGESNAFDTLPYAATHRGQKIYGG